MQASVIIPTYNRRQWVGEAVASVLGQQGLGSGRVETIVVDDGSTDGTAEYLRDRFGHAIRLVVHQQNSGVAVARNTGAAVARGEWIAFLDSDDLWLPQKLARHLAFAEGNGHAISQTNELWLRNGRFVNPRQYHRKQGGDIFVVSLERCMISPSAVLIHRELWNRYGGFDPSLPVCEDYDLWLRITCEQAVGLLEEPLVIKRGGHFDQLSRRFWGMDRFRVASMVRLLLSGRLAAQQAQALVAVLERKCTILANGAAKRGRPEEAERYRALMEEARRYAEQRWPGLPLGGDPR